MKRQYQSDKTNRAVTKTYVNSWILQLTELIANNWNIGIPSSSQTTFDKVKYCSTGHIIVKAWTSHATPSRHQDTWSYPQESPVTSDKSDESTNGKPKATNSNPNTNQHQAEEDLGSETTVEEIEAVSTSRVEAKYCRMNVKYCHVEPSKYRTMD
jgi:hypothetical protein